MMLLRGTVLIWVLAAVEAVLLFILSASTGSSAPLAVIGAVIALVLPSVIGWFSGNWQAAITWAVIPYWVITLLAFLMAKSPTPVVVGSQSAAAGLAFGLLLYAVLGWLGHQASGAFALGRKR
jgi:hypothetical protein